MNEPDRHEPPARFSYAVGAGLGLLIGGAVGLFTDNNFPLNAGLGIVIGLVVAYVVRTLRP